MPCVSAEGCGIGWYGIGAGLDPTNIFSPPFQNPGSATEVGYRGGDHNSHSHLADGCKAGSSAHYGSLASWVFQSKLHHLGTDQNIMAIK